MLIVYAMLIIVAACSSVVLTYLQLNAEDSRWPWYAISTPHWRETSTT